MVGRSSVMANGDHAADDGVPAADDKLETSSSMKKVDPTAVTGLKSEDEGASAAAVELENGETGSVVSHGDLIRPSWITEPVLSEIGITERTPEPETSASGGSAPSVLDEGGLALRPLSIGKAAGVADVQEFDFWRRPDSSIDGQPVSSPKLWPHGGALREGFVTSSLGEASNVRDPFVFTEGYIALLGAEVGEFGEGGISDVVFSGGMRKEVGSKKEQKDAEACLCGEESLAEDQSEGVETCKPAVKEVLPDLRVGPLSSKADCIGVAEGAQGGAEICEIGVDRAESNSSAFATNPTSSSSGSTVDSTFSVDRLSRKLLTESLAIEGKELAVVPEEKGLVRLGSEGHLSDSASVSSSAASPETVKFEESMSAAHNLADMQEKAVSGRVSNEVASTSGRTGSDSPKSPPKHVTLTPVVARPLYTDTPAMANEVVFGISTIGKLGRSNSFATGSVKGATVFASDGPGHRRTHSDVRRVSFALDSVLEEKKSSGGSSPSSPKTSIKGKERVESYKQENGSRGEQGILESRKQGDFGGVTEKKRSSLRPGSTKTEGDVTQGHQNGKRPEGARGQVAASGGGSPKVIDRSALFKRWLEKNKGDLSNPEQDKGVSPTPILHRTGSSNDVLPPTSARHQEKPSLKRTTSHSALSPPRFSSEIQSLDGGCESPTPSPRKSASTPSSPTAGKYTRQLSIGSSKPPKAPRSPPSSPLPPKHPHSPSSKSRTPKEKVASLSLGPATIDASVDLGPSTSSGGGSSGGSPQSSPGGSRNFGRLPPARVPSPKTNSVLRKAMSHSRAEPSIHVGSELVDAGLPADPKDAIPQLIARIIKTTAKHPLKTASSQSPLTAPKLSQVAPLPQKGVKDAASLKPETASTSSPSQRKPPPLNASSEGLPSLDSDTPPSEENSFSSSLMSLSPRSLLRSTSLPSFVQSVLPASLFPASFSAQVSLTAPEPKRLVHAPHDPPPNPEESLLLLGRLALAGVLEQEHARALLAQARAGLVEILLEVMQRGTPLDQEAAAGLARVITLLEEGRNALLELDGLKVLVDLLWSGTPRGKVAAAGILRNLAYKATDQKRAIMAAGAIGPLVSLLRSTTPGAPEAAGSALRSLAMADGMEDIIVESGAIQPLVRLLHSPQSPAAKEASAATLQNLATSDAHRDLIVQAGAVTALCKMLLAPEISSQMAAAGALRNLAAGGGEYQIVIGESGAVGPLVKILGKRGPNVPPGMPEAAAGALANLSLHADNKVLVSQEGGVPALTELVKSGSFAAQLVGMEALKNLGTDPEVGELILKAGLLPVLVQNLGSSDPRMQRGAVRLLHVLSTHPASLQAFGDQGVVQALERMDEGQALSEVDDVITKLLSQLKGTQGDALVPNQDR